MTIKVIQWATGTVGEHAVRGIVAHPQLELAGLWVHSEAKEGVDAGELVGIDPTGVIATRDADELLASDAEVVCYTANSDLRPDGVIDDLAVSYTHLKGFDRITETPKDFQITVQVADGASVGKVKSEIEGVLGDFPGAEVNDLSAFVKSQTAQIDIFLNMLYVFLALAVFIALLGIANTLALSIFERTREVGLLRAVGMVRSQVRSMIRWESVIIAVLGTVLGLLIGLVVAGAMMASLRDQGFSAFDPAPVRLLVITVLSAMAGVLAALRPARRAAKMDVLEAVSSE